MLFGYTCISFFEFFLKRRLFASDVLENVCQIRCNNLHLEHIKNSSIRDSKFMMLLSRT